jgi:hypothetical protein
MEFKIENMNRPLQRSRSSLTDDGNGHEEPPPRRPRLTDDDNVKVESDSESDYFATPPGSGIQSAPAPEATNNFEEQGRNEELEDSIESRMALARDVLKRDFGFDNYKPDQENVIRMLLAGKNCLALLPTNAGKSLCYQLPAVYFEELDKKYGTNEVGKHGITLVICPLISLMTDQINGLKDKNIAAEAINSSQTKGEVTAILKSVTEGKLKILLCAPERCENKAFVQAISKVPGGVRLFVVDEAHCISEVLYYQITIVIVGILTSSHSGVITFGLHT